VVGFGRVGRVIGEGLKRAGVPFVALETSVDIVTKLRAEGIEAQCGNAAEPTLLEAANLAGARLLFVAIPIAFEAGQVIEQARLANPASKIVARAHFDAEVAHLAGLGADSVVMGEREIAAAMVRQAFPEPGAAPAPA
jgi:CPA2 family monovalent cation:H+ antiporter-2